MGSIRRLRAQEGLTLIEVLVAVAVLGLAFTAILGGMSTSIIASDIHRKRADVETVLRSFAEDIKALPYVDCATTYSSTYTPPTGFAVSITGIAYWNPADGEFVPDCSDPDAGLQKLTLQAESPDDIRQITQSFDIVKRR